MEELPIWLRILIVVGMLNFFTFIAGITRFGGDALNGYARDGHYFLGSKGSYTEVSREVWQYSYYHGTSVSITHPLMIVAAALWYTYGRKRRSEYAGSSAE